LLEDANFSPNLDILLTESISDAVNVRSPEPMRKYEIDLKSGHDDGTKKDLTCMVILQVIPHDFHFMAKKH